MCHIVTSLWLCALLVGLEQDHQIVLSAVGKHYPQESCHDFLQGKHTHTMKTVRVSTVRWYASVNVCAFFVFLTGPQHPPSHSHSLPPSGSVTNAISALFQSLSLSCQDPNTLPLLPTPSHSSESVTNAVSALFLSVFSLNILLTGPPHPPSPSHSSGSVTNAISALFPRTSAPVRTPTLSLSLRISHQ